MNSAEEILEGLVGEICWGTSYDSQLNLSLSFGEPYLRIREPLPDSEIPILRLRRVKVVGAWWLWVYLARWRLVVGEIRVTGSSSRKKMGVALTRLEGQRLAGAQINGQTGATKLTFDLGARLEIYRWNKGDTDDLWTLYEPQEQTLSVTGDGRMARGFGSEPSTYRPIG